MRPPANNMGKKPTPAAMKVVTHDNGISQKKGILYSIVRVFVDTKIVYDENEGVRELENDR
jgi:hypothetical protein